MSKPSLNPLDEINKERCCWLGLGWTDHQAKVIPSFGTSFHLLLPCGYPISSFSTRLTPFFPNKIKFYGVEAYGKRFLPFVFPPLDLLKKMWETQQKLLCTRS